MHHRREGHRAESVAVGIFEYAGDELGDSAECEGQGHHRRGRFRRQKPSVDRTKDYGRDSEGGQCRVVRGWRLSAMWWGLSEPGFAADAMSSLLRYRKSLSNYQACTICHDEQWFLVQRIESGASVDKDRRYSPNRGRAAACPIAIVFLCKHALQTCSANLNFSLFWIYHPVGILNLVVSVQTESATA